MSDSGADADGHPQVHEGELIDGLQEDPNYFALKYNELQQAAREQEHQAALAAQPSTNRPAGVGSFV